MDLGGGAVFGGLMVLLLGALAAVYGAVRLRHGRAPRHAQRDGHSHAVPSGDEDPVPREAGGGMPMAVPDEQGDGAEQLQDKARRNR